MVVFREADAAVALVQKDGWPRCPEYSATFDPADLSRQRLRDHLWPSGIAEPVNQKNLERLRQWVSTHALSRIPVAEELNAASLAEERRQAIKDLSVP